MRTEGDNMIGLRRQNRAAVLLSLHRYGGLSRKRLASMLHLTPAAMTKIAAELLREGLIVEDGSVPSDGGTARDHAAACGSEDVGARRFDRARKGKRVRRAGGRDRAVL